MTREKRRAAITAAILVLLAVLACGPLGGGKTPEATEAPPTLPLTETPVAKGRCGDGTCDGPENAQNCPQDCGPLEVLPADTPILPAAASDQPLYVTIYYHVEPNPQLFEAVEAGYFEAVSLSLREMSSSLAEIGVHATFCFAWLYNDLVYCRNHDPQTGEIVNSPQDTGIETYEQIIADGHELAYHTHPPYAIKEGKVTYYARPNSTCQDYDTSDMHRWSGMTAGYYVSFEPGVYQFDDPNDPWHGQFIWERTSETLFWIADYLGVTIRHTNGGQKPMLDIMNKYGSGINHEHSMQQLRSLMNTGFDLISPEVMSHFNPEYEPMGTFWADSSTGYVTYLGPEANLQMYYPDIKGGHIENAVSTSQGLTFMPVHKTGQVGWGKGNRDQRYYDPKPLGGTGGGGVRWRDDAFYLSYPTRHYDPWVGTEIEETVPSLSEQFNNAMQRHQTESLKSVNAWGFNHHVVNVMWTDFSGLSDNWNQEIFFLRDIADGQADGVINESRPDLVQFVTMQELSDIYDTVGSLATK